MRSGPRAPKVPALLLAALTTITPGCAGSGSEASAGGRQGGDRPNILFIFSDDHAAHALSAYRDHLPYGAELPDTPGLDRLAADGMLFVNAFVTNSICAPSRATVLSGQYGHLNGVMTNVEEFHPSHVTFPALLRASGYRTAIFGKWHLKADPGPQVFDHYELLRGQGPYYNPTLRSAGDSTSWEGYTPDIVSDRAMAWMDGTIEESDAPFLAMVQFNAAHRYWDPGPDELELYRDTPLPEPATMWDDGAGRLFAGRTPEMTIELDLFARDLKLEAPNNLTPDQQRAWDAAYDAENAELEAMSLSGDALTRWKYQRYITDYMRTVAAVDANVTRLLQHLEDAGLADNTIVVYTSDQGFFLGDHGWFDKRWMYEESLRTPLLVRWPGVVEPGSVNRDLVMNLDFARTLLDAAGVDADPAMQGMSLVPLLHGERVEWRDAIYYQYFEYPGWHMVRRQYGVRTERYKLIHFYEEGGWELFDLERDPSELRSVYDDPRYRSVVTELEGRLADLREQYGAPEVDPVPHREFDAPADLRRPGVTSGM